MNKNTISVGIAALLFTLVFCAYSLTTNATTSTAVRWEYIYVNGGNPKNAVVEANKLGAAGWELATADQYNDKLIFKRRLP